VPLCSRDLVQGVDHRRDLEGRRPSVRGAREQQFGGLAEVAGLPHGRAHPLDLHAGGGGHRAGGELLGHAQVHPGELRRDQALAQVTDPGQQLGRGLGQQRGEPVDQRQPRGGGLQVTVGLGDHLVLHSAPFTSPLGPRGGLPAG